MTRHFLNPRESAGFTLVETLVAVTIVTLSVVGPLYAADRAIVAAQVARNQLTASYLAQEGIEYVRSMRDDEYLAAFAAGGLTVSATGWNNFLTNGTSDPAAITACRASACLLDPTRDRGTGSGYALAPCSGSSCTPLYLLDNGIYTQRSSADAALTPYTRTIQVLDIPGTADAAGAPYPDKRLVSTVTWSYHGTLYTVTVTDHLTPWQ